MVVPGSRGVLRGQLLGQLLIIEPGAGKNQAAVRRQQRHVSGGHRAGGIGVQEVQDRAEDDADRPGRVDDSPQVLMAQDGRRVTQVRADRSYPVAGGQQRPDVRQHHRVGIDVGDPGCGQDRPHGLVDRRGDRKPRAQVDELPDPLPGRPANGRDEERSVLLDQRGQRRVDPYQPHRLGPVGSEVILAAQPVVVDPRHVWHGGIQPGSHREHRPGVRQHGGPGLGRIRRHVSLSRSQPSRNGANLLRLATHGKRRAHTAVSRPQPKHPASGGLTRCSHPGRHGLSAERSVTSQIRQVTTCGPNGRVGACIRAPWRHFRG